MGDLDLDNLEDDQDAQEFSVAEVILHPGYKSSLNYHDIALIRLNESIR